MTDYQEGDDVTLRLAITPDGEVPVDGTTVATAVAYLDDRPGRAVNVAPVDGDRARWVGVLTDVEVGEYRVVWTVVGTGAGVQSFTLPVAPATAGPLAGRTYATTGDLAAYIGEPPPPGARRLLLRASRKVDQRLRTAVYPVDVAGLPTDPGHRAALREATCEQLLWWRETGDRRGSGAVAALAGAQIGTVKLPGGGGAAGSIPEFAPAAEEALAAAGLLNHGPLIAGREGALRW